jgi:hypothetical protein
VGLQIIGPHFSERGLLDAAYAVEQKLTVNVVAPVAAGGTSGGGTTDAPASVEGEAR